MSKERRAHAAYAAFTAQLRSGVHVQNHPSHITFVPKCSPLARHRGQEACICGTSLKKNRKSCRRRMCHFLGTWSTPSKLFALDFVVNEKQLFSLAAFGACAVVDDTIVLVTSSFADVQVFGSDVVDGISPLSWFALSWTC
jgi:hypothetical protein